MRAKQFFYTCAGILLLVIAYSVGARNAEAQAPNNPIVGVAYVQAGPKVIALTENGDAYMAAVSNDGHLFPWVFQNNVFPSSAVQGTTMSGVKQEYRK